MTPANAGLPVGVLWAAGPRKVPGGPAPPDGDTRTHPAGAAGGLVAGLWAADGPPNRPGSPELKFTPRTAPWLATAVQRAEARTGRGREGAPPAPSAPALTRSRCLSDAEVTLLPRAPATCRTPFFVFPPASPARLLSLPLPLPNKPILVSPRRCGCSRGWEESWAGERWPPVHYTLRAGWDPSGHSPGLRLGQGLEMS